MKPHRGEFLGLAEVGFVELTVLGAIGVPVPGAVPLFAASGQGTLWTVKGKRACSWLIEPRIPGI